MRYRKKQHKNNKAIQFETLEQRILFSADFQGIVFQDDLTENYVEQGHTQYQPVEYTPIDPSTQGNIYERHEVVFIDDGIENHSELIQDILKQKPENDFVEFVLLSSEKDGIEQITTFLSEYEDIDAIHILSHGEQGKMYLGNSTIALDNVDQYTNQLLAWSQNLEENADINFYGCDLAGNEEGKTLIRTLSALTGADIAASTDITGSHILGGDWELEYQVGVIESESIVDDLNQNAWTGTLQYILAPIALDAQVNTTSTDIQSTSVAANQAVAMDSAGNYVVVWGSQNQDGSGWGIYGQRFDSVGTAQGSEFLISNSTTNDQQDATVAMDDNGNFTVVWTHDNGIDDDIYARQFASDGTALGNEFLVNSNVTGHQQNANISMDSSGNFVIIYQSHNGTDYDILGQRFNSSGVAQGAEFTVNTFTGSHQSFADIAMADNGNFVVTWIDQTQDGSSTGVYAQRFDSIGTKLGSEFLVNTTTTDMQRYASVAMDASGNFVIIWESNLQDGDQLGIYGQRYNESGTALGGEFLINTLQAGSQSSASIAMDDTGNFTVAWTDSGANGSAQGIFAQDYDSNGVKLGIYYQVNAYYSGIQDYSSIAMNGSKAVIVWSGEGATDTSGIFAKSYTKNLSYKGLLVSTEEIVIESHTTDNPTLYDSSNSAVSVNANGDYVVAWTKFDSILGNTEIYAQKFNSQGMALSSIINVSSGAINDQIKPVIALADSGEFAVVWMSDDDTDPNILVRRYDANNNAYSAATIVNTNINGFQGNPDIAMRPDGTFIVTWVDESGQDGDGHGVYARIMTMGGSYLPFLVNTSTTGNQTDAHVAVNNNGNFVVTWSEYTSGGTYEIIAQRFDASGNKLGGEIPVNSYTAGDQRYSTVGIADNNYFVVVYASQNQDGSGWGIYSQQFNDNGLKNGQATLVSQVTNLDQFDANITMDGFGNYTVVWTDALRDGSGNGIFLQQYNHSWIQTPIDQDPVPYTGPLYSNNSNLQVNTTIGGNQEFSSISVNDSGQLVVVWSGQGEDGNQGVFQKVFKTSNTLPTSSNNTVTTTPNTDYIFSSADFAFTDSNVEQLFQIQITNLPVNGQLTLSGASVSLNDIISKADIDAGLLKFTPSANESGTAYANFSYKVSDRFEFSSLSYSITIDVDVLTSALAVWGANATSSPEYSTWNGSTFSANAFSENVGEWRIIAGADSPTRNESIIVGVDDSNQIQGEMWNGSSWSALPINPMGTISQSFWWGFDVAYESSSGDAIIVWNNGGGGSNPLSYSIWNGSTWTTPQTMNVPLPGEAQHLQLVASPNSDEMVLIVSNDSSEDYALVWDGSSWANQISLASSSYQDDRTDIYVTYEQQSGHAMVVYGKGTSNVYYRMWDGSSWSAENSITAPNGVTDARWTTLASDPNSDRIALGVVTNDQNVWLNVWDGNSWGTSTIVSSNASGVTYPTVAVAFESNSGQAIATYGESDAVDTSLKYRTWDVNNGWSNEQSGPGIGATQNSMMLYSDPNTDRVMLAVQDNDSDLNFVLWDGDSWGTPVEKETNTGETKNQPFIFLWDVQSQNQLPTAANKTVTTNEDVPYTFTSSDFGFLDGDGDSFTQIQISSLPNAGSLELNGVTVSLNAVISVSDITSGNLKFVPATNANGMGYAGFDFKVHDGKAYSASAYTITIDVNSINDAPTSVNSSIVTNEDTIYTFAISDFNFADVDGDSLASIRMSGLVGVGSLELNGVAVTLNQVVTAADISAGKLKFVPQANQSGIPYDSFNYEVNDGTSYSTIHIMSIHVTSENDSPIATNNTITTGEDTAYTFTTADFNFTDIDGDSLSQIQITALPGAGSLKLNGVAVSLNQIITVADINAGNLKFMPALDKVGNNYANFNFKVHDGTVFSSSDYTITINITDENDLPTASNNTVTTNEDIAYTFSATDFNFSDVDVGDSLSQIQFTTLPGAGSLELNGVAISLNQVVTLADLNAGNLKFVPAANGNGTGYANFNFKVHDGVDYSANFYTMTIDVTAVNDLPTANANIISITEDTPYTLTALDFNFNDIDGDSLFQVQFGQLPSSGHLYLSGVLIHANDVVSIADINTGNLVYVPPANLSGNELDVLVFKVHDGTNYSSASYKMAFTITPDNDLPLASNNTISTNEDTTYTFSVADFNFTDIDGDSLSQILITSIPGAGSLELNGLAVSLNQVITAADINAGNLKFVPAANANGSGYTNFNFKVHDGTAYSANSYIMTIDVTAVNDAPTANHQTVITVEGVAYTFTAADFNFTDIDGDALTQVQITALPGAGSLELNGVAVSVNAVISIADINADHLKFVPGANENGNGYANFNFRVHDGTVYSSAYTITIDVAAQNDAPTASHNTVSTSEDTAYTFTVADFNFTDIDGDSLSQIQITALPGAGSLELNGVAVSLNQIITVADLNAGNLKFVPAANANGASYAEFEFKVHDGIAFSASAYTMTVDVTAVNDLPTASNNTVSATEDTTYTFTIADFGFTDIDGDSLTQIQITALPGAGSLELNGVAVSLDQVISVADINAGNLKFVPAANANGSGYANFSFKVHDGSAYSANAYTMTVDVTAVNDLPTSSNNTVSTTEDTAYTFSTGDFGFTDIDADSLTQIQITVLPGAGSLELNGMAVSINQVISVADINAGNLKFVPATNANGSGYSNFNFKVHDGSTYSTNAYTMTVDVTAVNDLPTSSHNTISTNEDSAYTFTVADFNITDIEGDSLSQILITALPGTGSLELNGVAVSLDQVISVADLNSGNLKFVPAANTNGSGYANFSFKVHDGSAYSANAYIMTIDVTAVNDAPTANHQTVTTVEGVAYTFTAADFNFTDIDGDALTQVQITALPGAGSLELNGVVLGVNAVISIADINAGHLKFVPGVNENGNGYANFNFRVHDGTVYSSAYTITIDVAAQNDAPTASHNTVSANEDTAYTFTNADFNFTDIDGDSLSQIQITALPGAGSLELNGVAVSLNQIITVADLNSGNLKFVPAANANGLSYAEFEFKVHDGIAFSASAYTMTVDVTAVNDQPTSSHNTISTNEDTTYIFTVADFNFTDIEGDSLSQILITALPGAGSLQLNGVAVSLDQVISVADINAGNLKFVPAANANGSGYANFSFTVHDGSAYSANTYTMTIDVTAVNDLPTSSNNTVSTNEDTTYTFSSTDFGFTDIDGDSLNQIQITALPGAGSLELNSVAVSLNQVISADDINAGNLNFVPAANANGSGYANFGFKVHDGSSYSVASHTLTIDLNPQNDLPSGNNLNLSLQENTIYTFVVEDFGFSDLDGDNLTQIQILSIPLFGSLELLGVPLNANTIVDVSDINAGNLKFVSPSTSTQTLDNFNFKVHDGTDYSVATNSILMTIMNVADEIPTDDGVSISPVDSTIDPNEEHHDRDGDHTEEDNTSNDSNVGTKDSSQEDEEEVGREQSKQDSNTEERNDDSSSRKEKIEKTMNVIQEKKVQLKQPSAIAQEVATYIPNSQHIFAYENLEYVFHAAHDNDHSAFMINATSEISSAELKLTDKIKMMMKKIGVYHEIDSSFNSLNEELAQNEDAYGNVVSSSVKISTATLSALSATWVLRGGSIVASFVSTLPVWKGLDMLPILSTSKYYYDKHKNDEIDELFDSNEDKDEK